MSELLNALAIAYPSPMPFIAALILCSILLLVLIVKYPTLRAFRKKKTFLVYVAAGLVFGLLIFQAYDTSLGPSVFTSIIEPVGNSYKFGKLNQFNISVTNLGQRAADFYLLLTSVNASLEAQNQPGYEQINSTALKIPFSIPGSFGFQESKSVFFIIDENVASFTIKDIDYRSIDRFGWTTQMYCRWNVSENCFSIIEFAIGPT
jgi:hypothetical protein